MTLISSSANERIKEVRALRSRKERSRSGLFFAEGLRIVIEARSVGFPFKWLIACPELLVSPAGRELLGAFTAQHPEQVLTVTPAVFQGISDKEGPQGLAAVLEQRWITLDALPAQQGGMVVALDEVADPGNLGTVMRTADAAGVSALILLDHCTDAYDPAAVRASMGAVFNLPLLRCSFAEFLAWKQRTRRTLVGAAGQSALDYHAYRYPEGLVLLMGSERQGLPPEKQQACDALVSIPMLGRSDSLNLAMATGILLYEILNQRRDRQAGKGSG